MWPREEAKTVSASVLIADDDPNIVRALRFLMHREGHDVRTVTDGEKALAAIEEMAPDLVLLDLMMPKGSGYEVCRTLRANRSYDNVSIIMLTAKGREDDQRVGMSLGADAYITKPFAIEDVVRCVANVLGRRQTGLAAAGGDKPADALTPRS
jgi:DNA-binding response OmpR family regulator